MDRNFKPEDIKSEKGEVGGLSLNRYQQVLDEDGKSDLRHLLFLAWHFPPAKSIASIRTWNLAKHLSLLNWSVTVVTPNPDLCRYVENEQEVVIKLREQQVRRILTGHRMRYLTPYRLKCWNSGLGYVGGGVCRLIARRLGIDDAVGWLQPAEKACAQLSSHDVDLILASGPPFAAFELAGRLSSALKRPYVLDYRDPWTGSPHADHSPRAAIVRKEARLLRDCAAVTVVSASWADDLSLRFGDGNKVHVVTNGYDPEDLFEVSAHHFDHMAIVYAGTFYQPKRVISPLMESLRILKESRSEGSRSWLFHYYGEQHEHILSEAARYGVLDKVSLHGVVSRNQALAAIRGAGVAVVITSVFDHASLQDRGIIPGKLFEILGLGTPILLIAPRNSDATQIIHNTGSGRAFAGNETKEIASYLKELSSGYRPVIRNCKAYTWPQKIKDINLILRSAVRLGARSRIS